MINLRQPDVSELPALSTLCIRSKAHWGYDEVFMEACREELTLQPSVLEDGETIIAEEDNEMLGIAKVALSNDTAELDLLYVSPDAMGKGVGRLLIDWSLQSARSNNATVLSIVADPHAVEFYKKMGGRQVGTSPSESIPGRELPKLEIEL